ncbi:MAG: hypothetical protein ABIV94_05090 [Acidimicrobiales bacterium]
MNRRRASAIVVAVVAPLLLVAALVALRSNDTTPRKLPVASGETERSASFAADAGQSSSAFGGVRYEAGPGLPTLTGVARAYRVTSDVDADAARRVARSLGVEGEPHEADGSFTFASPDGGALYVSPVGGGSFSYSSAAPGDLTVTDSNVSSSGGAGDEPNGVQRIFGCVAPAEPTTTGPRTPPSGGCTPQPSTTPPYPETFLSEADAKAKALDVLTAAGVATEGAEVEAHEDGYLGTWQISVSRVVDGMTADGLQSSVTFDAAGIRFAYGSLGQVEPFDEYPLIGTTASIAHLNDGTDPLFRHRGLETSGGEVRCSADGTCSSEAAGSSVCPANATCDLGEAEAPPASAPPTTFACPADGSGCSVPPVAPTPSCAPAADALCPSLPCDLAPGGSCEQICKTTGNPGDTSTQGCWFAYSPCPTVTTVPDGGDATLLCLLPDLPCGKPTSDAPPYPCPPPDACGFYPSTPTTCLPSPPATSVPLEPQVVTLTEATLGLMLVPSGASDAYLVPVYRFTAADGFGPVALAIDAAWLEPPPPPVSADRCPATSGEETLDRSDGCSSATDGVVDVPCSTPDAEGPCFIGPPETLVAPAPDPPTTCGPPVAKADGPTAGAGAAPGEVGCPIN